MIILHGARMWRNGRRSRLKICRWKHRAGSIPAPGTRRSQFATLPAGLETRFVSGLFYLPSSRNSNGNRFALYRDPQASRHFRIPSSAPFHVLYLLHTLQKQKTGSISRFFACSINTCHEQQEHLNCSLAL